MNPIKTTSKPFKYLYARIESGMDQTQELFEVKQKFLREIPHPKLIRKHLLWTEKKGNLASFNLVEIPVFQLAVNHEKTALEDFLNEHINAELQLKHRIALANDYKTLRDALVALYNQQLSLFKKLQTYLPGETAYPDLEIKMSDPTNAYELLKSIQELKLSEKEINHYLCSQLAAENSEDVLLKTCLRANKIIVNG